MHSAFCHAARCSRTLANDSSIGLLIAHPSWEECVFVCLLYVSFFCLVFGQMLWHLAGPPQLTCSLSLSLPLYLFRFFFFARFFISERGTKPHCGGGVHSSHGDCLVFALSSFSVFRVVCCCVCLVLFAVLFFGGSPSASVCSELATPFWPCSLCWFFCLYGFAHSSQFEQGQDHMFRCQFLMQSFGDLDNGIRRMLIVRTSV